MFTVILWRLNAIISMTAVFGVAECGEVTKNRIWNATKLGVRHRSGQQTWYPTIVGVRLKGLMA